MKFTNVSGRPVYLQCCHREVAHLGTFSVPWLQARHDRGIRMAMSGKAIAWKPERDEPEVPGSPAVPKARKAAKAPDRSDEIRREAEANAALSDNMSRMGRFDVPQLKPRTEKARKVSSTRPVTDADVIRSGSPRSLEDIRRHNAAIRHGK